MKKEGEISVSKLAKKAAKIKINKQLTSIEEAPFFKEKMKKGARMLSVAGLPKLK